MRAARGLIRWTGAELAKVAKVSLKTIERIEKFDGPAPILSKTEGKIIAAFETRHVTFWSSRDAGYLEVGVRFRVPEAPG